MKTIAVINQKGGVGKTTTAVNLSAALAAAGRQVCLIDIDPQAHATLHLGVEPSSQGHSSQGHSSENPSTQGGTIYDVLTGDARLEDVWQQAGENLWVVPSHIDLAATEVELAGIVGREVILRDKLAAMPGRFDYVIVDCPPSLGLLTINALSAVDEVLLPLQPHFLALHGLSKLLETIELVAQRLNDRLRLTGVVLCLYESGTRLAAEVTGDVETFFHESHGTGRVWSEARIFMTRVRRNIRLAEAPSFGQTIFQYAPESNGAADYRDLASELLTLEAQRALVA